MANIDSVYKYHERPISRTRTLYRIPTVPNDNRVLELYHNRLPILADYEWPGTSKNIFRVDTHPCPSIPSNTVTESENDSPCHFHYLEQLPFPDNSFDLIILHHTLDDLTFSAKHSGTKFDTASFLNSIAMKLVPNGLLAGCVANRISKKNIIHYFKNNRTGGIQTKSARSTFSLGELRKLLSNNIFSDARIYNLLPNSDEPLRLVDVTPRISKIAFRHEIEYARGSYSRLGYLIRSISVEAGLYPYLEESFFFWAYRRC